MRHSPRRGDLLPLGGGTVSRVWSNGAHTGEHDGGNRDDDSSFRSRGAGQRRQEADPINDRFEEEAREFHVRVREGFLDLAAKHPDRFVVIDAAADIPTIHARILETVNASV